MVELARWLLLEVERDMAKALGQPMVVEAVVGAGGTLALVKNGDLITLDVAASATNNNETYTAKLQTDDAAGKLDLLGLGVYVKSVS